jgi:hypothetical protein
MKGSKGFAALEALKNEMDNQRKAEELRWHEEMVKRHDELMQKRGFHTPEEMIDYLMSGKKIVDRTGQSFQFVDGVVEFIYEIYDEAAGPLGFGKKYKTLAQFKEFVYGVLDKNKDDEWMPIWVKDEQYEFI